MESDFWDTVYFTLSFWHSFQHFYCIETILNYLAVLEYGTIVPFMIYGINYSIFLLVNFKFIDLFSLSFAFRFLSDSCYYLFLLVFFSHLPLFYFLSLIFSCVVGKDSYFSSCCYYYVFLLIVVWRVSRVSRTKNVESNTLSHYIFHVYYHILCI